MRFITKQDIMKMDLNTLAFLIENQSLTFKEVGEIILESELDEKIFALGRIIMKRIKIKYGQ